MPRTHRTYENDFRQEAVNLLFSSGRPLKRVATELGRLANSLRSWRGVYPPPATRSRIPLPPARDL